MKANIEKTSATKNALVVETTGAQVTEAFKKAIQKIKKEAKIPGFREGKAPDDIVKKRFGKDIELEAIKEVFKSTYEQAVTDSGAKPISQAEIEPVGEIKEGKPFTYKAHFEVYPEFTAKGYEGLKLESEKFSVDDKDVEAELERLRQQMTQLEPASDGELKKGMIAMIDFKGTADGKPFAGSEAENYVVDFGSGQLLAEFELKITGMKEKEEREIKFNYPKDYFKKEMAGAEGVFTVKVKELRKKIVPELNDDFAKELGKYSTLKEVRDELKKRIVEYKEMLVKNSLKEQAIRELVEKHKELEVPFVIVEGELGHMLEQLNNQLKSRGQTLESAKIDTNEFIKNNLEEAKKRARGYMVVSAISKQEKIELAEGDVEKRLADIAAQAGQALDKVRAHFEKNNLMANLRTQILFEKTLDFVVSKAKISEVKPKKDKK